MTPEPLSPSVMADAAEEDRIAERRQRVLALKLRRMSQASIAAIVQVDQATVSRDLKWIRDNWRAEYGIPATVSPAEEIGMAVALYEDSENAALLEYHSLKDTALNRKISPMFISRQRMACLRTAMVARQMRLTLLQDVGLIDRQVGTVTVASARADDIRSILRDEGLLTDAKRSKSFLASPEELEGGLDDDGLRKWLQRV